MKEKKFLKPIIFICAVAVFILLYCLLIFMPDKRTFPRDDNLQIVFIGDSNLAFRRDDTDIPEMVAKLTGATTYNCAMGGTTAVKLSSSSFFDSYYDRCCLYNLVDVMLTQDAQEVFDNRDVLKSKSNESLARVELMADMDYSKVDYLFIAYGLNDYALGYPTDDTDDKYNIGTYCGSMRTAIEKLQKEFPQMKIVLCSITYCWSYEEGQVFASGHNRSFGGGVIDDYRDALYSVSEEYDNVYFLDNLELLNIDENNYQEYLVDDMHLNGIGQQMWAKNAAELVNSLEE